MSVVEMEDVEMEDRTITTKEDLIRLLINDHCDISKDMTNIKVLDIGEKSSVSDSIIIFGDIIINGVNKELALKITFETNPSYNLFFNSLDVEQQIYTGVIENMIDNFHSPHLTSCIGRVKLCDTEKFKAMLSQLSQHQRDIFINNKEKIETDDVYKFYDLTKANMLILSRSSGKTLFDYLINVQLDDHNKINMLFQILYTLRCFERVGLSHNDLHVGNIFVDVIQEQERIYYISDNQWVKTKIKYDTKIFDFDRSSIKHPSVDRNFRLDNVHCREHDQCNKYSSRRDLSAILLAFYKYSLPNSSIKEVIESIVGGQNGPFLTRGITRYYLQNNIFLSQGVFRPDPEIDEKQLPSIAECIYALLTYRDKHGNKIFGFSTGFGKSVGFGGNSFRLPKEIIDHYWKPKKMFPSSSTGQQRMERCITDEYTDSVVYQYLYLSIKPDNIFEKEFGKNYFEENTKKLFRLYMNKRKFLQNFDELFIIACYLLCIPFLYKFDKDALFKLLSINNNNILKLPHRYNNLITDLILAVDDVWNIFNNELPISMIKI
jgi:hypothetical protein